VSRQVISEAERAQLFTLAGLALPPPGPADARVDPLLERLVLALSPWPAYAMNPWRDLVAYNDTYAESPGGLDQRPSGERNILWTTFAASANGTDPAPRLARRAVSRILL
jgi:hypothetical protein